MEEIKLDVQIRNEIGSRKIKILRDQQLIPAIVYGEKQAPTPIKVNQRVYEKIMRSHRGQSVIFHLNVTENDKTIKDYSAILKEEQHNPVTDNVIHIDFQQISLKKEIEVKVPILVKGEAIGVKQDGGSLDHHLRELDVICLPMNIPQNVSVEVSHLKIGDAVHVKDIVLPSGVRTKHDLEAVVVSVVPPMKEEVEAPAEVGAGEKLEPEVIKKKEKIEKAEEEGETKVEKKEK